MTTVNQILTPTLVGILETLGTDIGNVIANYSAKVQGTYLAHLERGAPNDPEIVHLLGEAEEFIARVNHTIGAMMGDPEHAPSALIRAKAELDHFEQAVKKRQHVAAAYNKKDR